MAFIRGKVDFLETNEYDFLVEFWMKHWHSINSNYLNFKFRGSSAVKETQ